MSAIIWVHEDALSRDHPVFSAAGAEARPVFIWDENDFKKRGHSFKKLVFIYECLQDMQVDIIKGETTKTLKDLCSKGGTLYAAQSFNPALTALLAPLGNDINVEWVEQPSLSDMDITPDMTRFFRYWNKTKRQIMSQTAD